MKIVVFLYQILQKDYKMDMHKLKPRYKFVRKYQKYIFKSLCFEWSKKRGELFIGSEDGTISVWNA